MIRHGALWQELGASEKYMPFLPFQKRWFWNNVAPSGLFQPSVGMINGRSNKVLEGF